MAVPGVTWPAPEPRAVVVRRPPEKGVYVPVTINLDAELAKALVAEALEERRKPICNGCLPKRRGVPRKASGCIDLVCTHHASCFLCGGLTDGRYVLVGAPT